jgi:hypothetical protein
LSYTPANSLEDNIQSRVFNFISLRKRKLSSYLSYQSNLENRRKKKKKQHQGYLFIEILWLRAVGKKKEIHSFIHVMKKKRIICLNSSSCHLAFLTDSGCSVSFIHLA